MVDIIIGIIAMFFVSKKQEQKKEQWEGLRQRSDSAFDALRVQTELIFLQGELLQESFNHRYGSPEYLEIHRKIDEAKKLIQEKRNITLKSIEKIRSN